MAAVVNCNAQSKTHTDSIETYESFDVMGIDTSLLRSIYAYGFENPSMIQQKAIRYRENSHIFNRFSYANFK